VGFDVVLEVVAEVGLMLVELAVESLASLLAA